MNEQEWMKNNTKSEGKSDGEPGVVPEKDTMYVDMASCGIHGQHDLVYLIDASCFRSLESKPSIPSIFPLSLRAVG